MNASRLALSLAACGALSACGTTRAVSGFDYTRFTQAAPRSVLIVPVINHSNETQAADLFLTTLAVPLAERGFYIFPTNMSKKLIDNEGLSDPGLVHTTSTPKMASLFDADTVLYVEILDWKSRYAITASVIEVKFLYTLKDGKTGQLLWQKQQAGSYSTSANSGNFLANLLANAITSMIQNGKADYTPIAAQANTAAFLADGVGLPYGPYSRLQKLNENAFRSTGSGKISDATVAAISLPIDVTAEPAAGDR